VKAEGDLGVSEFLSVTRLGTRGGPPVEIEVGGQRALRIEPTLSVSGANIIGGHPFNGVASGVQGATVAGGGFSNQFNNDNQPNGVFDNYGTVGGGLGNQAGSDDGDPTTAIDATVGGGNGNEASGEKATVGGGFKNEASAQHATVGGGRNHFATANEATVGGGKSHEATGSNSTVSGGNDNEASGFAATVGGGELNKASGGPAGSIDSGRATVGGGRDNTASGSYATVPGGYRNIASRNGSFAAGTQAKAGGIRSFVWSDGTQYHDINDDGNDDGLSSEQDISGSGVTGNNTFHASASAGFRFVTAGGNVTYISGGSSGWATTSTRAAKTNIDPVEPQEVLDGVTDMEVATWEYKDENGEGQGERHIGPMAEEFHKAVDVGQSDEHINSINADGVALAAIQGLAAENDEKDERIEELESEAATARKEAEAAQEEAEAAREENARLRERLAAVEETVTGLAAADAGGAATPADD
jgi:FtsZ-binding cell division protein ZapB